MGIAEDKEYKPMKKLRMIYDATIYWKTMHIGVLELSHMIKITINYGQWV